MITLKLNGKEVQAREGQTVLEAAAEHGIKIPTLCYHKDLNPSGSCRMCVVEVEGSRTLQTACTTQVWEGMQVKTESESLFQSRKQTLEMMLANYSQEGERDNELFDLVREFDAQIPDWGQKNRFFADSDPNPFIRVDLNECVLCGRCVQACAEIQVRDVWGFAERGYDKFLIAGANTDLLDAGCETCGQCVAYCPTDALTNKIGLSLEMKREIASAQKRAPRNGIQKTKTTCTYCGVGCQFDLLVKDEKVIGVESNPNAPVNGMALCVKGRYGWEFIHNEERLTKPLVRRYLLTNGSKPKGELAGGENPLWDWVEASWEQALDIAAEKLYQSGEKHGADSLGILTSAKCTNEENYLMNKFARQVVGTNNIDHCARL